MGNLKKELITMIERMEQNTFLLPDGYASEYTEMKSTGFDYRSYVGGRKNDRYIHFTIRETLTQYEYTIKFSRGDTLYLDSVDILSKEYKRVSKLSNIYNVIKAIYEETFSFKDFETDVIEIKKKIREVKENINKSNIELNKLNTRLEDALKVRKRK